MKPPKGSWGYPAPAPPLDAYPEIPEQDAEAVLMAGYRNVHKAPRTAPDGREHESGTRTPVDWDLAVGEPLARGRKEQS